MAKRGGRTSTLASPAGPVFLDFAVCVLFGDACPSRTSCQACHGALEVPMPSFGRFPSDQDRAVKLPSTAVRPIWRPAPAWGRHERHPVSVPILLFYYTAWWGVVSPWGGARSRKRLAWPTPRRFHACDRDSRPASKSSRTLAHRRSNPGRVVTGG